MINSDTQRSSSNQHHNHSYGQHIKTCDCILSKLKTSSVFNFCIYFVTTYLPFSVQESHNFIPIYWFCIHTFYNLSILRTKSIVFGPSAIAFRCPGSGHFSYRSALCALIRAVFTMSHTTLCRVFIA